MKTEIIINIENALNTFRGAITDDLTSDEKDDYENLAAITDKILKNYYENNLNELKQSLGGFSRKVSDSYSKWPEQFQQLSTAVTNLRKEVLK